MTQLFTGSTLNKHGSFTSPLVTPKFKYKALMCSLLLLPVASMAFDASTFKDFEVSVAAGPTWGDTSNTYVQSTRIEVDMNHVDNVSTSTSYQIGVGYHLFADKLADQQYFNDFLVQLNLIHSSESTISGTVWADNNPNIQNQSFKAPYTSTRLMLDLKPTLFSIDRMSFYPIAGLGIAWNRISYSQELIDGSDWYTIDAPAATSKNLAYDLGFGVRGKITENLSATLEYMTTHLGGMEPADYSTGAQPMYDAPNFNVRTDNILFGLSWRF